MGKIRDQLGIGERVVLQMRSRDVGVIYVAITVGLGSTNARPRVVKRLQSGTVLWDHVTRHLCHAPRRVKAAK